MPTTSRHLRCAAVTGVLCLFTSTLLAAEPAKPASPLTLSGDIRLRYEWDWDSQNGAGVARADRDRARARARASLGYKFSNAWSFGARARTGNRDSQQSPHLTFHANDDLTDDLEVALDRYFLQYKQGPLTVWGGRNTTPFWQQNEMFWDEDVTPTGVAVSHDGKFADGSLTATAGAFYLPDGMTELNGTLVGGQLKYGQKYPDGQLTLAAGLYSLDGKRGATHLRNRNGVRGYLIGVLSAQWSHPLDTGLPLVLGVDLIKNFEDYTATDAMPFAARHADETSGWVLSVSYGSTKNPGDWQAGYFYAHIETLAVNASYAQDDWARFGSATQSDLTDIKGHELRYTYVITPTLNVQARLFLVEAITNIQDGKRFRLDLNWKF
ncbi:MAG TPA: putative porin [Lacunisphaera sp.]|nr:putative porin [Lacunisphaera sp.]